MALKVSSLEDLKPLVDAFSSAAESKGEGDNKRSEVSAATFYEQGSKFAALDRTTIDAVQKFHVDATNAAAIVAANMMMENAKAMKEAGEDHRDATARVVLRTPEGQIKHTAHFHSTGRDPKTGEATSSFGRISTSAKISKPLGSVAADYASEMAEAFEA